MHTNERLENRHVVADAGDEGFTLIELLVVLLIIGILLAIAIPTFLSTTKTATNTSAQANLKTALAGADTFFTTVGAQSYAYIDSSAAGMSTISSVGTGLTYVSGSTAASASSGPQVISLYVANSGNAIVLTALAHASMDCWGILDIKSPLASGLDNETATGTYYFVVKNSSVSTCIAQTVAPTAANVSATAFPHG
ncbi:MAG: prepilin-type N-terminal cleavage/methylation domain-containing protein [Acidimicrobiales bacterium]